MDVYRRQRECNNQRTHDEVLVSQGRRLPQRQHGLSPGLRKSSKPSEVDELLNRNQESPRPNAGDGIRRSAFAMRMAVSWSPFLSAYQKC